jgi:hypothetical protein
MLTRIRAQELYKLGMCKTMKDAMLQVVIGNYDYLIKKHLFKILVKKYVKK